MGIGMGSGGFRPRLDGHHQMSRRGKRSLSAYGPASTTTTTSRQSDKTHDDDVDDDDIKRIQTLSAIVLDKGEGADSRITHNFVLFCSVV